MMHKKILSGVLLVVAGIAVAAPQPEYELMIVNGRVFDGDGSALDGAEIGISGGRIVAVEKGLSQRARAQRRIDAQGLIVAPGFVDPHTHAASALTAAEPEKRANLAWAYQGVTTVVVGNDGDGFAALGRPLAATGTNFAVLSGFGRVRRQVMGEADRAPSDAELAQMQQVVARDMCAGALGFSSGLYYAPQSFATTREVAALASVAGKMGGYYDTHLRDEGNFTVGVVNAIDEALEIARQGTMPLHIAHIKALGPVAWGRSAAIIERIEQAQARGQKVTADQYPWDASGTRVSSALLPRSAVDGGLEALRRKLSDPAKAAEIEQGIATHIANRGGADRLLITGIIGKVALQPGKTLAQVATEWGITPAKLAIEILRTGDANLASFNMSAANIEAFAYKDWVVTGSDGSTGHPRMYGSFPKAWTDLVRKGKMPVGRFIARSTGDTVRAIGLEGRGFMRPGMAADIVIFDPENFAARATYVEPTLLSAGVHTLLVNGVALIEAGRHTGALPGQHLKKTPPGAACPAS